MLHLFQVQPLKSNRTTPQQQYKTPIQSVIYLMSMGRQLSSTEVQNSEEQLRLHPENLMLRFKLIGYYAQSPNFIGEKINSRLIQHIKWLIVNHPEATIFQVPIFTIVLPSASDIHEMKHIWDLKIDRQPTNLLIVRNAATFLQSLDSDSSLHLLDQLLVKQPLNPEWPKRIGVVYRLKAAALNKLSRSDERKNAQRSAVVYFSQALRLTKQEDDKIALLSILGPLTVETGEYQQSLATATELLVYTRNHNQDKSYGDAIYSANSVLGRLALRSGDIQKAKMYLLAAGKTPGSPVLHSFGPDMKFAEEMIQAGEQSTVLEFFEECRSFWKLGYKELDQWTQEIQDGKQPNFKFSILN